MAECSKCREAVPASQTWPICVDCLDKDQARITELEERLEQIAAAVDEVCVWCMLDSNTDPHLSGALSKRMRQVRRVVGSDVVEKLESEQNKYTDRLNARIEELEHGLRIIAGREQCVGNLLSDRMIAETLLDKEE